MTTYPCTRQPPCENVKYHLAPVCPKDIVKHRYKSTAKQLKDSVLEEYDLSKPKEIRYFNNPYGYGSGKYEIWDADGNREGLYWRKYVEAGHRSEHVLESERWFPGQGPDNVEQRSYNPETGIVIETWWEKGKGPNGLKSCGYYKNGNVLMCRWEAGIRSDHIIFNVYHLNGMLKEEEWEADNGPDGLMYRLYYDNGQLEEENWSNDFPGPNGIVYRKHDKDGNIIDEH